MASGCPILLRALGAELPLGIIFCYTYLWIGTHKIRVRCIKSQKKIGECTSWYWVWLLRSSSSSSPAFNGSGTYALLVYFLWENVCNTVEESRRRRRLLFPWRKCQKSLPSSSSSLSWLPALFTEHTRSFARCKKSQLHIFLITSIFTRAQHSFSVPPQKSLCTHR